MRVTLNELIRRSNNQMTGVHEKVRTLVIEIITRSYQEGINVQISSGFRSDIDQAFIYGQGRKSYIYKGVQYARYQDAKGKRLPIVSNAKPFSSIHNYGLAVDFFLTTEDGRSAVWIVNSKWKRVAAIAKSLGFTWGGDWKSFPDNPHIEYTRGLSLNQIQQGRIPTFIPIVTASDVQKAVLGVSKEKPYRLLTGTFKNDSDMEISKQRLNQKFPMVIYEREDRRLMSGTFQNRTDAIKRAEEIKSSFGWTVYVMEA